MSKNTNLSFLTDYITADITNGRIGINNASPTVAFDVVGATKITGVLTLTSTISNGTYAYTLPSATGTLALTSALSGYLPLTGGTLTGALGGTSASFSATTTFNGVSTGIISFFNAPSSGGCVTFQTGGVSFADIGSELGNFGTGSATNLCVSARSGKDLILGGGALKTLTLASTGAATFSSSVTANAELTLSSTGTAFVLLNNTTATTGKQWRLSSSSNGSFFITQPGVADVLTLAPTTGAATFSSSVTATSYNATTQNIFAVDATERMRITSTGLVAIGRSTPENGVKLLVADAGGIGMEFSPNANVPNENRLLSYDRVAGTAIPMNYSASIHKLYTGYNNLQTSTKTASSGGNTTFSLGTDYAASLGDNSSGIVIISISQTNSNVTNPSAVWVGTVINPRGSGSTITQISTTKGSGISTVSVSGSLSNQIIVNASTSDGSGYRASMTFIGGGGIS